jgi:magnesium-transporting ATPase (P-type)
MIVVYAMLRGYPDILQPLHVLWINAITDGLPALAMGLRSYDENVLSEKPRDPKTPILDIPTFFRHMITGVYMAIASNKVFSYWYNSYGVSTKTLGNWNHCQSWPRFTHSYFAPDLPSQPCDIFTGKLKAVPQTMVLASIVTMELLKALGTMFPGAKADITKSSRKGETSMLNSIRQSRVLVLTVIMSFIFNWLLIQVRWLYSIYVNFD